MMLRSSRHVGSLVLCLAWLGLIISLAATTTAVVSEEQPSVVELWPSSSSSSSSSLLVDHGNMAIPSSQHSITLSATVPTFAPTVKPSKSRKPTFSPSALPTVVPYYLWFQQQYVLRLNHSNAISAGQINTVIHDNVFFTLFQEKTCQGFNLPVAYCSVHSATSNPSSLRTRFLRFHALDTFVSSTVEVDVDIKVLIDLFPSFGSDSKGLYDHVLQAWTANSNQTLSSLSTSLSTYSSSLFSDIQGFDWQVSSYSYWQLTPTFAPTSAPPPATALEILGDVFQHPIYLTLIIIGLSCLCCSIGLYWLWRRYFHANSVVNKRPVLNTTAAKATSTAAEEEEDLSPPTTSLKKEPKYFKIDQNNPELNTSDNIDEPTGSGSTPSKAEMDPSEMLRIIESIKQRDLLRKSGAGREVWLNSKRKPEKKQEDEEEKENNNTSEEDDEERSNEPVTASMDMTLDHMTQDKWYALMHVDNRKAKEYNSDSSAGGVERKKSFAEAAATPKKTLTPVVDKTAFYHKYNANTIHGDRTHALESLPSSKSLNSSQNHMSLSSSKKVSFRLNTPGDIEALEFSPDKDGGTKDLLTSFRSAAQKQLAASSSRASFYEKYNAMNLHKTPNRDDANSSISSASTILNMTIHIPKEPFSSNRAPGTPTSISSLSSVEVGPIKNTISEAAKCLLQASLARPLEKTSQKSSKPRDTTSQFNLNLLVENKDGIYDDQTKQAIKSSLKETYAIISQAKAAKQSAPKRTISSRGEKNELNIANQIQRPNFSAANQIKSETAPAATTMPSVLLSPSPWVSTSPRAKKKRSDHEDDAEIVIDMALEVDDCTVALIDQDYRTLQ